MERKRKFYKTFTLEFKIEAVRLIETSEHPSSEVARELGIRRNRLYKQRDQLAQKGDHAFTGQAAQHKKSELRSLKQENTRLKEEIEILKMLQRICEETQVKNAFIQSQSHAHSVHRMCKVLGIFSSGYYDWLSRPKSNRALESRLLIRSRKLTTNCL